MNEVLSTKLFDDRPVTNTMQRTGKCHRNHKKMNLWKCLNNCLLEIQAFLGKNQLTELSECSYSADEIEHRSINVGSLQGPSQHMRQKHLLITCANFTI